MSKIIGVIGNYEKSDYFKSIDTIFRKLKNYKYKMILSNDFLLSHSKQRVNKDIIIDTNDNIIDQADIIFSVGGDGTLLSTARLIGKKSIPILGVHIGSLGFLAGCNLNDLDLGIKHIATSNYKIEKRLLIKCAFNNKQRKNIIYALNDVVINNGYSGRLLNIELRTKQKVVNTYLSDGIIFSTPTGSTAYSLSAGGPIIHHELKTITVTPICPHSLSSRPIVLSDKKILEINFPKNNSQIALTVDGQIQYEINYKTKISIQKANYYVKLVHFPFNEYFSALRSKMGWVNEVR